MQSAILENFLKQWLYWSKPLFLGGVGEGDTTDTVLYNKTQKARAFLHKRGVLPCAIKSAR
jgi:hypothetical protein